MKLIWCSFLFIWSCRRVLPPGRAIHPGPAGPESAVWTRTCWTTNHNTDCSKMSPSTDVSKQETNTLRVSAAADADGFIVNLQADGTGELALDALSRGCQRARAAAGLLLLPELCAPGDKAPKHRHHGARRLDYSRAREELFKTAVLLTHCQGSSVKTDGTNMATSIKYLFEDSHSVNAEHPRKQETCGRSKHREHDASSLTSFKTTDL